MNITSKEARRIANEEPEPESPARSRTRTRTPPPLPPVDVIRQFVRDNPDAGVPATLGRFLLSPNKHYQIVAAILDGERGERENGGSAEGGL